MINILLTGVGGQGTVLAAKVLAVAAATKGWKVRTAETIGMAQRGGSVVSHVRMGNFGEPVHAPLVTHGCADLIIAFEPGEAARVLPYLSKTGTLVTATSTIEPVSASLSGDGYESSQILEDIKLSLYNVMVRTITRGRSRTQRQARLIPIDDAAIIRQCGGNKKILNSIMLAAASAYSGLPISVNDIIEAIEACVKPQFVDMNVGAIRTALEMLRPVEQIPASIEVADRRGATRSGVPRTQAGVRADQRQAAMQAGQQAQVMQQAQGVQQAQGMQQSRQVQQAQQMQAMQQDRQVQQQMQAQSAQPMQVGQQAQGLQQGYQAAVGAEARRSFDDGSLQTGYPHAQGVASPQQTAGQDYDPASHSERQEATFEKKRPFPSSGNTSSFERIQAGPYSTQGFARPVQGGVSNGQPLDGSARYVDAGDASYAHDTAMYQEQYLGHQGQAPIGAQSHSAMPVEAINADASPVAFDSPADGVTDGSAVRSLEGNPNNANEA